MRSRTSKRETVCRKPTFKNGYYSYSNPKYISNSRTTRSAAMSPSRHPRKKGAKDARTHIEPRAADLDAPARSPASPQPSVVSEQPSETASLAGAFDRLDTRVPPVAYTD